MSKAKYAPTWWRNVSAEVVKERGLQIVSRPEVEANEIKEDGGFSFSAVFEIKPAIELKDYLGVEVEKVKIAVSEEQVDEALKRLQEGHARLELVEGRDIVQKGDFVTVDFEGTIAGKPFAGGKGENYVLEVGAGHTLAAVRRGGGWIAIGPAAIGSGDLSRQLSKHGNRRQGRRFCAHRS